LYNLRWGVEGFFGVIKERVKIENFTGKTVISVKQDFFAIMFLSLLRIFTHQSLEKQLFNKSSLNKHRQTVKQKCLLTP
jgi:hypothetical protein